MDHPSDPPDILITELLGWHDGPIQGLLKYKDQVLYWEPDKDLTYFEAWEITEEGIDILRNEWGTQPQRDRAIEFLTNLRLQKPVLTFEFHECEGWEDVEKAYFGD